MTQAPHAQNLRSGQKMGPLEFVDTMLKDGLWDAFQGYHMGTTAENVAEKYQITREQQDQFAAAASARRARRSRPALQGRDRAGDGEDPQGRDRGGHDEYPKPETTAEVLAKLRPAFSKTGTVTAGNASGINDGAAVAVVMSAEEARKRGVTPLARIVSWATAGVDPPSWARVRSRPRARRCRRRAGTSARWT
jgi:acetyl-CoA C-acetyltransferase